MKRQTSRITNRPSVRAFTLIEVLIAAILVGMSIAALVVANGTLTMANGEGTNQSTAEFLAEQIRELTALLPVVDPTTTTTTFGPEETNLAGYDDLDDFDGAAFSPPIGANRAVLSEFSGFTQEVTVQNVNPSDLDLVVADHSTSFVQITVRVLMNNRPIVSTSWIRAKF